MRILVVEDEQKVARFLKKGLEAEGFEVEIAEDGEKGERLARSASYELILLDVLLPVKDGFTVLRNLRKDSIKTPIIMLTARTDTEDIVGGLDQGADDYLGKPFSFDVLLARIRSVVRRSKQSLTKLTYKDLTLDTVAHKAYREGTMIELTSREYTLLEYFMRHQGELVTRKELARNVWGYNFDPGTNVIDVYVTHLRKKIDAEFKVKLIQTERGKGYYLSDKKIKF
ncbi:MAG: response regulator transcription factor [Bacteroidetes bacterium]|nr:response regulator transcription factor [Bacteroidota bacterium]